MKRFDWKHILAVVLILLLLFIGFKVVPSTNQSENSLLLIAFAIGIICGLLMAFIVFGKKLFQTKNKVSDDFSNPFIGFAKAVFVGIFGVGIITLLAIQYFIRKPIVDFTDGQPAAAKILKTKEIRTHSGSKYQVDVRYLINKDTIETFDIIYKAELKYISKLDSVPIVFSAAEPRIISIITTDEKLEKIKKGEGY